MAFLDAKLDQIKNEQKAANNYKKLSSPINL